MTCCGEREMPPSRSKSDQFQLRLPPGLRDRIRNYAEREGRSMNEEIVRLLEREFPPPASIKEKLDELLAVVGLLRHGRTAEFFGRFSEELFSTLIDVANGKVKVDEEVRLQVQSALEQWSEADRENAHMRYTERMSDKEAEEFERTGSTAKFTDPDVFPED
ncbi:MAG: Arc family DNA-binding protein [Mesorhizobium sp.]|uniref:Arc family DNA-binding protein n=1 Tax=Mesorhizobium sp. TaxID=1871066 RepID=UPI0012216D55|nr:Arc family DNA-binding protein [Mesorhizobium sp.]TIT10826.1 MAG: Arc family DNA-binding protein [Mesorhizobium sp.]